VVEASSRQLGIVGALFLSMISSIAIVTYNKAFINNILLRVLSIKRHYFFGKFECEEYWKRFESFVC
jgi:hypothetical protein